MSNWTLQIILIFDKTQPSLTVISLFVHGILPQSASYKAHGFVKTTNLACTLLCKIQAKMPILSTFAELLTKHYLKISAVFPFPIVIALFLTTTPFDIFHVLTGWGPPA